MMPIAFQIVASSAAQNLPHFPLLNGGVFTVSTGGSIAIGNSPSVSANNSYVLSSGSVPFRGSNTSQIWIIGTGTLSFMGV